VKQRKLLSQRHPLLYFLAVWTRRLRCYGDWYFDNKKYAKQRTSEKLAFRIKKHQSVLLKKLGESDMQLQVNKVTNLNIATKQIDGILIRPGETFSFCKLVGLPYGYHVIEKDHKFLKIDGQYYRKNEIWRDKILKFKSGQIVETELITKNFARVTYTPDSFIEEKA